MNNPVCPQTGASMHRGVRPMTLEYKGANATFDMPGWYCDASEESIHTGEDMEASDRALNRLKVFVRI
jgi:HTH-type transcriptional regulator / antitoxin MqsA